MHTLQEVVWKEYMTGVRKLTAYAATHADLPPALSVACLRFAYILKVSEPTYIVNFNK